LDHLFLLRNSQHLAINVPPMHTCNLHLSLDLRKLCIVSWDSCAAAVGRQWTSNNYLKVTVKTDKILIYHSLHSTGSIWNLLHTQASSWAADIH